MPSIKSALLANPLPLSEVNGSSPSKPKSSVVDAAKVAKDFEGVFASMMLKEMRNTLEPGSLFGEDSSDIYGGMFDQYLGQQMTESGGFGLAQMIRDGLSRAPSEIQAAAGALSGGTLPTVN